MTIFLVVAIVILLVGTLFFFLAPEPIKTVIKKPDSGIELFINECIKSTATQAITIVGQNASKHLAIPAQRHQATSRGHQRLLGP